MRGTAEAVEEGAEVLEVGLFVSAVLCVQNSDHSGFAFFIAKFVEEGVYHELADVFELLQSDPALVSVATQHKLVKEGAVAAYRRQDLLLDEAEEDFLLEGVGGFEEVLHLRHELAALHLRGQFEDLTDDLLADETHCLLAEAVSYSRQQVIHELEGFATLLAFLEDSCCYQIYQPLSQFRIERLVGDHVLDEEYPLGVDDG